MAVGDLRFYSGPSPLDRLVDLAERLEGHTPAEARLIHVAVEVGADPPEEAAVTAAPHHPFIVEAVAPHVRDGREQHAAAAVVPWGWRYRQPQRDRAVAWLREQTWRGYGWEDVADHVFHLLGLPVELRDPARMDCSHLVFAYLTLAGEDWVSGARIARLPQAAHWPADPYLVTPADLYRYTRAVCAAEGQLP